jgi:peptidoglycan-N-acetylglucosamine deacetylase
MPDDHGTPAPAPVHMARRRLLLVAAGGLAVGIATVAGRGGGSHLANSALDDGSHHAPRPDATTRAAKPETTRPATRHTPADDPKHAVDDPKHAVDEVAGEPVYYVNDGPKVVALTIDDGPSPVYTPQVLQVLARYGVTASFSMIGENVTYYPSVAREVADAGHTIVNHTWNHVNLTAMTTAQLQGEIEQTTDAIHSATGKLPSMFRAPYGAWSRTLLWYCAAEKLLPLDWSVDPADWSRPGVGKIVKTIMNTTRTGSIILEHDGGGNRAQTVAALKIVIPRLLDEGYRFAIP